MKGEKKMSAEKRKGHVFCFLLLGFALASAACGGNDSNNDKSNNLNNSNGNSGNSDNSGNNYGTEPLPIGATLSVSPPTLVFSSETDESSVELFSDRNWAASCDMSWCAVEPDAGKGNGTVKVSVLQNTGAANRYATVEFKITDGDSTISRKVGVTQPSAATELSVSRTNLDFERAGGEGSFEVSSDRDWTVTGCDWCEVTPKASDGKKEVRVRVSPNNGEDLRVATLSISTGTLTRTVSVMQTSQFGVYPASLDFAPRAGEGSFNVFSDTTWTATGGVGCTGGMQGWCSVVPPGSGNGNGTVRVNVMQNTTGADRSTTVTIRTIGGTNLTRTVIVTQASALKVSLQNIAFNSAMASSESFNVVSDRGWTASCSTDWCTVTPESGNNDGTVTVNVLANSGSADRDATVTIRTTDGTISRTVAITQAQPTLTVSPQSLDLDSGANEGSFSVTSNADWNASCNQTWCTVVPNSGSGNRAVSVRATQNSDIAAFRSASVTITAGTLTRTVLITQPTSVLSISSFSPIATGSGDTLVIQGTGFSAVPSNNSVRLGEVNVPAANIISATPTALTVRVPQNKLCTGFVQVTVAGMTAVSATVFIYVPATEVSTLAGSTSGYLDDTGTAARFAFPQGITIDTAGNLYVADPGNNRIRKVTPGGVVTTLAGSTYGDVDGMGTAARFSTIRGITIDAEGNLYVADANNRKIRKVTPQGMVSTLSHATGALLYFSDPFDIAIDTAGNLYVTDSSPSNILKVTPEGAVSIFANGTETGTRFRFPQGIAIDAAGNLYVADTQNNRICKVTPQGVASTLAGSTQGQADGMGTAALFYSPHSITIDAAGNLYVTDYGNRRVRKVTPDGIVSTLAGSTPGYLDGPGRLARFGGPQGITIDAAGNLYVADPGSYRIRKIEFLE
jgi:sugar lactone lactonase YvrE